MSPGTSGELSRHFGFNTPLRIVLATTAALWMGSAYPQALQLTGQRAQTELRFRDIYRSSNGPDGADLSDLMDRAHGRTVRITGYMVQQESPLVGHFMLAPRPVRAFRQATASGDDFPATWVMVQLDASQQNLPVPHIAGLLEVSGTLSVEKVEDQDGRVTWVRMRMDSNAVHSGAQASSG